jgi:hypothetical protein
LDAISLPNDNTLSAALFRMCHSSPTSSDSSAIILIKADSPSPAVTVNVSASTTTSLLPSGDNVRSPVLVDIVPSASKPISILSTTNESVIVTAAGKPTITLTSVLTLVTAVSISPDVPNICRSSVSKLTS